MVTVWFLAGWTAASRVGVSSPSQGYQYDTGSFRGSATSRSTLDRTTVIVTCGPITSGSRRSPAIGSESHVIVARSVCTWVHRAAHLNLSAIQHDRAGRILTSKRRSRPFAVLRGRLPRTVENGRTRRASFPRTDFQCAGATGDIDQEIDATRETLDRGIRVPPVWPRCR